MAKESKFTGGKRMFTFRVPVVLYDEIWNMVRGRILQYEVEKFGIDVEVVPVRNNSKKVPSEFVYDASQMEKVLQDAGFEDSSEKSTATQYSYITTLPFGTKKVEMLGFSDLVRIGADGTYYTKRQIGQDIEMIEHSSLDGVKEFIREFVIK